MHWDGIFRIHVVVGIIVGAVLAGKLYTEPKPRLNSEIVSISLPCLINNLNPMETSSHPICWDSPEVIQV